MMCDVRGGGAGDSTLVLWLRGISINSRFPTKKGRFAYVEAGEKNKLICKDRAKNKLITKDKLILAK